MFGIDINAIEQALAQQDKPAEPPPTPNTVEQMYQTVLGREGETAGVDYWKSVFGDEVDPNELATFKGAAQAELDKRSPLEQAALSPNAYFQQNPDVAEAYKQNNYGMTPAEFATSHYNQHGAGEGRTYSTKDKADDWFAQHPNATPQEVADTIKSNGGLTPELAKVLAEHYGLDANQIQNNYNQLVAPKSFQDQIYQYSPEAYNKLAPYLQKTANEIYGGKIQDYQVQMLTPLDITKTGFPTQLEFTPSTQKTEIDDEGRKYTYTVPGKLKTAGIEMSDDGEGGIGGYSSTNYVNINGFPVKAEYDANGKLTRFEGDWRYATAPNNDYRLHGRWDAQGNATPYSEGTKGGGFLTQLAGGISDITKSLGPIWTAAKLYNPALNLVDVGTNVAQGNFGGKTLVSAAGAANAAKGGSIGGLNSMLKRTKLRGM